MLGGRGSARAAGGFRACLLRRRRRCTSEQQTPNAALPCSEFPGEVQRILEWFRDYKIPDGKPANKFGYDNKALSKEFTW